SFAKLGLGKTHLISHSIDVGDTKAVKQRHYPVSPAVEKLLYGEVDRMMRLGVIEESQSAWSSPVVLVQKPGKVRLCLDCRKVNSFTQGDAYPLPQIDAILSRLPRAMFISSLDLKDAYWQIPLDLASRDKTASRLGRWAAKLQAYKFHIEHRKGKLHVVPDALSRAYEGASDEEVVAEVGMDYESPHFEAEEYKTLRETVEANGETVPDLKVMDGKVFRRT
ncbi:hypothetical protein KR074_000017, partial [Drosophila pseudoananassae]